jgi:hypothetical protein
VGADFLARLVVQARADVATTAGEVQDSRYE